jgi:hypothetical protein
MMDTRPVIILAFTNSPSSPLHYLSERLKGVTFALITLVASFKYAIYTRQKLKIFKMP